MPYLYRPQELKVYLYSVRVEYATRRWLELIKDYDLEVHYHPGEANVVADAFSRKSYCNCLTVRTMGLTLCQEMEKLNVEVIQQGSLTNIIVEANIRDQIIAAQKENKGVAHIKERVRDGMFQHR